MVNSKNILTTKLDIASYYGDNQRLLNLWNKTFYTLGFMREHHLPGIGD
ncbi:MAG: hypothetical protein HRT47_07415 [Candidatus Caenarcaniphilales bacterium]|nr:hypothetical protein [Candidatus Caenarcaniphilales bacterium]